MHTSKCEACKTDIQKRDLGASVENDGHPTAYWRHWRCICGNSTVILNAHKGADLLFDSHQIASISAEKVKRDVKEKDTAKHDKEEEKPPKKKRKTKTKGGNPSTEAPLTKKTKPAYGICPDT